jgi:hypothetical protein
MGVDMGRQVDDAVASASSVDPPSLPTLPALDLPSGDNLATVRAAYDWLGELSAWLSYYADAAKRVGHPRTADLHSRQLTAVETLRAELRRMWFGNDVATPTVVDELRHSLATLNFRLEQLLSGSIPENYALVELGPEDEFGGREIIMRQPDQEPWESDDDYWARRIDDRGKQIVRDSCAEQGVEPPVWARLPEGQ